MRRIGLAGLRLRRRHRTTIGDPAAVKASDLIGRDFTAQRPNTRYVGDITYLPIADGTFRYLASEREARLAAFGWLHRYNTRRRHSHLGQMSPIDYENNLLPRPATLTHAA